MLALLIVAIAGLLLVHIAQSSMDYASLESYVRAKYQREHIIAVAEGIETYYRDKGLFPASLPALASSPQYEDLRFSLDVTMGYAASGSLNDGTWRFSRVVAFLLPLGSTESAASYAAKNYCGVGDISTAVNWCGDQRGTYFRRETRDTINEELTTQQVRLNRLQSKFARYYNAAQKFPDEDSSNVTLSNSSVNSLASLAGYSGTAANCAGVFQYMGIPLDCGDMFDKWGGPVSYQFETATHVIFISESPFFNSAGDRVIVAVDRT